MSELKQAHYALLEKIAERARSLWQESQDGREAPDTVVGRDDSIFELSSFVSDTRFDFDSIVMHSQAYRRSMKTLKLYDVRKQALHPHDDPVQRDEVSQVALRDDCDSEVEPPSPELAEDLLPAAKYMDVNIEPTRDASCSPPKSPPLIEQTKAVREDLSHFDPEFDRFLSSMAGDTLSAIPRVTNMSSLHRFQSEMRSIPVDMNASKPPTDFAELLQNTLPEVVIQSLFEDQPSIPSPSTVTPRPSSAIGLVNDPAKSFNDRPRTPTGEASTSPIPSLASTLSPQSSTSGSRSTSNSAADTSMTTLNPVSPQSSDTIPPSPDIISLIPLKAVIIGDTFCGKSAMGQRLATGTYWADHYNQDPRSCHKTSFSHSGHRYYLDFLDQPGHVSMNDRPSFHDPCVNVVLMCFAVDSIESLDNLQYVMEPLLNTTYLGVPAILIGCKTDLRLTYAQGSYHDMLVAKDQAQATQAVLHAVDYLECSAATSKNSTDVLIRAAHWAMQHQSYVAGLSRSRRLFRRPSSISRLNVQQTREKILEHRCDFRQWAAAP